MRNYMQADCPRCGHSRMGPHRNKGCGMTDTLFAALKAFRAKEGKRWKSILREVWFLGQDTGTLRELRNVVGPGGNRLEKIERYLKALERANS